MLLEVKVKEEKRQMRGVCGREIRTDGCFVSLRKVCVSEGVVRGGESEKGEQQHHPDGH